MSNPNYRFRLGTFECSVVSDGSYTYHGPAPLFFSNATPERLAQALRGHGLDLERWDAYVSPYPTLLIRAGPRLVLVDTGAGGMAPSTGKLIASLQAEDVTPGEIDVVILTHAHQDHSGGIIDADGRPAFRNARYVMRREEWEFWIAEPDGTQPERVEQLKGWLGGWPRQRLPAIRDQLELIDRDQEIVPGVRAVAALGHTPGHIAVAVTSSGEKLLYTSDAALHPIHLEQPEWYAAVDVAPEQALASRRRLAEQAASEKALVLASHLAYPGLGQIVPQGDAWRWQPVERAG